MKLFLTFVLTLSLAFLLNGQMPVILKDINPGAASSLSASILNNDIIAWGNKLIFIANDGVTGNELWATDGSELGTVLIKDINPGASGSDCRNFIATSSFVFFTATNGADGYELWRTDGTSAGTTMIKDIQVGTADGISTSNLGQQERYFVWNDMLYFTGNDGTNGAELWKSDGTAAGTNMLKNIGFSGSDSSPAYFAEYNGKLYFQARGTGGAELWVTDGTATGTVLVKDINVGGFGSSPSHLIACNGNLLFIADDNVVEQELWRSDGTATGTVLVKDINTAQFGSGMQTATNTSEKRLVKIGDVVYFSANDGTGTELWRSDGTDVGTFMVKDASTDMTGYTPQNFAVLDNILYYKYNDNINGIELWRSDGTAAGTSMVKDIKPGSSGSFYLPTSLTEVDGTIWFGAEGDAAGIELWKSDGTEQGTQRVADINIGSDDAWPFQFAGINDNLIFGATSESGIELWKLSLLPPPPPLTISLAVLENVLCFGDASGALSLVVEGGVPPYDYVWSPATAQGSNPTGLPAGTFSVTATDATGTAITVTAEITQPAAQLSTTITTTAATSNNANGAAMAMVTGGTPPYSYLWDNTPPSTTTSIVNVIAGTYTVVVTDANGCTLSASVVVDMNTGVETTFASTINIAPTLSDGQFTILSKSFIDGLHVKLVDNAGRVIQTWDGVSSGQPLTVSKPVEGLFYLQITGDGKQAVKELVLKK